MQQDRKFPGTELAIDRNNACFIRHRQAFLLGKAKDDIANMVRIAAASLRQ